MQNLALEIRGIRGTKWASKRKRYEQGARRPETLRMLADQTDLSRWNSLAFDVMCQPANGARTLRSNPCENHTADVIFLGPLGKIFGHGRLISGRCSTHKGIVVTGDRADGAIGC